MDCNKCKWHLHESGNIRCVGIHITSCKDFEPKIENCYEVTFDTKKSGHRRRLKDEEELRYNYFKKVED